MANNEHFERARRIVASWPWWKRNIGHRLAPRPADGTKGLVAQLAVKQALIERQAVELERLKAELFEAREQVTGLTEALHGTQAENDRLLEENKGMLDAGGYDYLSKQRDKAGKRADSCLWAAQEWRKRAENEQAVNAALKSELDRLKAGLDDQNPNG